MSSDKYSAWEHKSDGYFHEIPTFYVKETEHRGKQEVFFGPMPLDDGERSLQGRCVVVNGDIRAIKAAEFMTKGKPHLGDYVGFQFYAPGEGR